MKMVYMWMYLIVIYLVWWVEGKIFFVAVQSINSIQLQKLVKLKNCFKDAKSLLHWCKNDPIYTTRVIVIFCVISFVSNSQYFSHHTRDVQIILFFCMSSQLKSVPYFSSIIKSSSTWSAIKIRETKIIKF